MVDKEHHQPDESIRRGFCSPTMKASAQLEMLVTLLPAVPVRQVVPMLDIMLKAFHSPNLSLMRVSWGTKWMLILVQPGEFFLFFEVFLLSAEKKLLPLKCLYI